MKSTEDRATAAQLAAAVAATERESLEARMAQVEATSSELRATIANAIEAAQNGTTAAAATEDAAQTAA